MNRLFSAKLFLIAIALAALAAISGLSFAQDAPAGDKDAASASTTTTPSMPTLLMEGRGQIARSSNPCSSTSCPGTFTAALNGRPFGKANLKINLSVARTADDVISKGATLD